MIRSNSIPATAKLIGPAVAAALIADPRDYEALVGALRSEDASARGGAAEALRYIVGSILAPSQPPARPLVGPDAPPWCDLLEQVSRNLDLVVAPIVRPLLAAVCDDPANLTEVQRDLAGQVARRTLSYAWERDEEWLSTVAMRAVCRTFESDPAASAALLRQSTAHMNLARHGAEEMPLLAQEVGRLVLLDADLVGTIYRAAFSYDETSREMTHIGSSGSLFRMTSTREQDYQGALYTLAQAYPVFLEQAPLPATQALIHILDVYVDRDHALPGDEIAPESFDIGDRKASIRSDGSAVWGVDEGSPTDLAIEMLEAFGTFMHVLAVNQNRADQRRDILDIIARENSLAIVWKRLLVLAAAEPETLGRELRPLAWAAPVLACVDTTVEAGNFIAAVFPHLSPQERDLVERSIVSLPEGRPARERELREYQRDRLIGCVPADMVVAREAADLLSELAAHGGPPPNGPLIRMSGPMGIAFSETDILASEGVPVAAPPNAHIRTLAQPVADFASRHQQASRTPQADEVGAIVPALVSLHEALMSADAAGVHPKQIANAWGILAAAGERIAESPDFSCDLPVGPLIRSILLEAVHHPYAPHDPTADAQFAKDMSWPTNDARISAAQGLPCLVRHEDCATTPVLDAIERLSKDTAPQVRYQIARRLGLVVGRNEPLGWGIAERLGRQEPNNGVLQGLLPALSPFASRDASRVAALARDIFDRVVDGPGASKVREQCAALFTLLYVSRDDAVCRGFLYHLATHPLEHTDAAHRLADELWRRMRTGSVAPPDARQDEERGRVFSLLGRLVSSVCASLRPLLEQYMTTLPDERPSEAQQQRARDLARLARTIARGIYLASRPVVDERAATDPDGLASSFDIERRFLREAGPILDDLADLPISGVAHDILQVLENLIPIDPANIFRRIAHIVEVSQQGGYQYETPAIDLVVRVVECYLADYRPTLQEAPDLQRLLVDVLDVFVLAGWPAAVQLTYHIGDIYR